MRIINHGIIRHRGRRGDNVSTHPSGIGRLNGLWKRDRKLFSMFSASSMSSVSYSNSVFSAFSVVKSVMSLLLCLFCFRLVTIKHLLWIRGVVEENKRFADLPV